MASNVSLRLSVARSAVRISEATTGQGEKGENHMTDTQLSSVLDKLGAVKDTMTVSRVFGESYQVDGVTIVPVATARGGGGGGGGEGSAPGGEGTGTGAGLGFGVIVRPLGVYIVKDGEVSWQPAIDVLRIVVGGQLLALAAILALRRRRKGR
jgi:uncharacterized spore protein YtfJ